MMIRPDPLSLHRNRLHPPALWFGRGEDEGRLERFFIETSGKSPYKRDFNWGRQMDDLAQAALLHVDPFGSSKASLKFLAKGYRKIRKGIFGRVRPYWDIITIPEPCRDTYLLGYRERACKRIQADQIVGIGKLPVKEGFRPGTGIVRYQELTRQQIVLDGKPVALSSFVRQVDERCPPDAPFDPKRNRLAWVMPGTGWFTRRRLYRHLDKILQQLEACKGGPKTPQTLERVMGNVAEIHWILTNMMPFQRGSAGIADLYTKTLLDALGVRTGRWAVDRVPDFEAFVTPLDEYKANYSRMFASSPGWLDRSA